MVASSSSDPEAGSPELQELARILAVPVLRSDLNYCQDVSPTDFVAVVRKSTTGVADRCLRCILRGSDFFMCLLDMAESTLALTAALKLVNNRAKQCISCYNTSFVPDFAVLSC